MTKFAFPIRILGVIGFAILLIVALAAPMRALAAHLFQEPTPRPTATVAPTPTRTPSPTLTPSPTPTPFLEVEPTTAAGRQVVNFTVRGFSWPTGGAGVILAWDVFEEDYELVDEPIPVDPDGTFEEEIEVPQAWAIPGEHRIIAGNEQGFTTDVIVILTEPTPTHTPTPITPTPTTSPTPTSTPSPTLAPITPMVTITPQPVTPRPTRRPTRTSTPTPRPGTNTATPTPSITPTVTDTPGPGTPSVTPEPTSTITPTSTPVDEISDTGVGWGPIFLWGFVLAGLVIVFRLLRVRNLQGEG